MVVKDSELRYLVALFSDNDEVVTDAVNKQLLSKWVEVAPRIEEMFFSEADFHRSEVIAKRMDYLNREYRTAEFQEFIRNSGEDVSLFEGGFIASSVFNLLLKKGELESFFLNCSASMIEEINGDRTAFENVKIFNHIFYNRLGFATCDAFITNESDALLLDVIKRKKGNPIAVSYLYFMFAQAAGLPIYPLCFPGGFVPVYVENGRELFYVNIFNKGDIFSEEELEGFMSGQGLEYDRSQFKVRSEKTVLSIYIESVQYLYSNNNSVKAEAAERLLKCIGEERFLTIDEDA